MNVEALYRQKVGELDLIDDPEQLAVAQALQELQDRIREEQTMARRLRALFRPEGAQITGLYLWGGVGRGKTFLLDLFFASLPVAAGRRVHFHRFMSEVHDRLRAMDGVANPLDRIAAGFARETRVLAFDEFFVSDIGDAMILGGLLDGLFRRGLVLVATSNSAPDDLYRDGLQRARFLPAIALLKRHTRVFHMRGDTDYRLRLLKSAGTWVCPPGNEAEARLDRNFNEIASGYVEAATTIAVAGRGIPVRKRAKSVAWFAFDALCEGPRSALDYIEIARRFQTVIVSGVPVLGAADEDAARRFIALVDEFYDRRVKLIVSAAAPADALYKGNKLSLEFERATSRLIEMQSTDYLHAAHLS